ncbi:ribosome silencing factor [Longimonas halophila]|uniref:Ribosomal silencing factor RsfS n=1 Tax=Longimonas halophila TaxID=1469170 RepID=A0A2H3NIL2_9BACT|nr:ribosome silencing factor [Longimonas halophila]PEN05232.1 ribosome silencing factor [Longimonas halophila]
MATPNTPPSPDAPTRRPPQNPGYALTAHAVDAMAEKKATDIVVLDLRSIAAMADFFVLGTGGSDVQIRAIANGVMDHIEETCGERPWQREGTEALEWVVLDYVDVVVHVFSEEKRAHYNIERLWGDADRADVPDDGDASDVELLQALSAAASGNA